jgi:hypothetical protein
MVINQHITNKFVVCINTLFVEKLPLILSIKVILCLFTFTGCFSIQLAAAL